MMRFAQTNIFTGFPIKGFGAKPAAWISLRVEPDTLHISYLPSSFKIFR
jgi:hypothetical protein